MQVNAEIHLGTWSVLEYLLSPAKEVIHRTEAIDSYSTKQLLGSLRTRYSVNS